MNLETCTEHDDAVVVYDGRGKYYHRSCPFCTAQEESTERENTILKLEIALSDAKQALYEAEMGDDL